MCVSVEGSLLSGVVVREKFGFQWMTQHGTNDHDDSQQNATSSVRRSLSIANTAAYPQLQYQIAWSSSKAATCFFQHRGRMASVAYIFSADVPLANRATTC